MFCFVSLSLLFLWVSSLLSLFIRMVMICVGRDVDLGSSGHICTSLSTNSAASQTHSVLQPVVSSWLPFQQLPPSLLPVHFSVIGYCRSAQTAVMLLRFCKLSYWFEIESACSSGGWRFHMWATLPDVLYQMLNTVLSWEAKLTETN